MRRGDVWTVAGDKDHAGKARPVVILQMIVSTEPIALSDDPTGKSLVRLGPPASCSQAPFKKIFCFTEYSDYPISPPVLSHNEGRFAVVTERGAGCGGRGWHIDERAFSRTEKTCGPGTPTLVSSL